MDPELFDDTRRRKPHSPVGNRPSRVQPYPCVGPDILPTSPLLATYDRLPSPPKCTIPFNTEAWKASEGCVRCLPHAIEYLQNISSLPLADQTPLLQKCKKWTKGHVVLPIHQSEYCRHCKITLTVYDQRAVIKRIKGFSLVTCIDPECVRWTVEKCKGWNDAIKSIEYQMERKALFIPFDSADKGPGLIEEEIVWIDGCPTVRSLV